jgi:hypothetical protein
MKQGRAFILSISSVGRLAIKVWSCWPDLYFADKKDLPGEITYNGLFHFVGLCHYFTLWLNWPIVSTARYFVQASIVQFLVLILC